MQVRGLSPRTCSEYEKNLRYFARWAAEKSLRWSTIRKQDIDTWVAGMTSMNIEAGTIKQRISILRTFYNWMMHEGITCMNPARFCQTPKKAETLPKEVSIEQIDKWLSKPAMTDEERKVNMLTAIITDTGLRLSEALNLRKSDFQHAGIVIRGKGKRERIVFYGQRTITSLRAYMPAGDNIFEGWQPEHARWAMYRTIGKVIPRIHPHLLRHTFAMNCLNKGMPIDEVSQLLGHKHLSSTQIYARAATETLHNHYNQIYM